MGEPSDRRALRSVALQFFANGAVFGSFTPRLPEISDRVGIDVGTLGVVLTIGGAGGLVSSLVAGRLVAHLGTKRTMLVCNVITVVALPVIGWATSVVALVVGLVTVLALAILIDVAMNMQGAALSARRHSPVMNRLHGLWSIGTVTAGIGAAVVAYAGVGPPVHLTAVAAVLAALTFYITPGLLPVDRAIGDDRPRRPDADDAAGGRAVDPPVRGTARRRVALLLALGGFTAWALENGNGDWAAFRLDEDLAARPGVSGTAFVAFTVGMTVGRFGGDAVQVRIGAMQLAQRAAVVAAVGTSTATLVPVPVVSMFGFFVAGLGASVMFPLLYDAAARAPGPLGSGFRPMLIGQWTAAVLVPVAIGGLADTDLSVGTAMAIVLLPCAVIALVAATLTSGRSPSATPR